ncbi:MAG: response regulator, partial [Gammaproteobacteria bacterium]|nr:response regulator [Gammaproteobacteria bacterium]
MQHTAIKVLLVEDDEDDFVMTRDLLEDVEGAEYEVEWVSSFEEAVEVTGQLRHDIFLFDYRLGAHSGLELIHTCKERAQQVPSILLTGQKDREVDMEAMRAGASDFIYKGDINSDLLERSIRYAMEQVRAEREI